MTRLRFSDLTTPVLAGRRAWIFAAMLALWAAIHLQFWTWWASKSGIASGYTGAIVTFCLLLQTLVPQWKFVRAAARMRRMRDDLPPAANKRVMMATSFVPGSESVEVLAETLKAMVAQNRPHDVWVCDEGFDRAQARAIRELVQRLDDELSDRFGCARTDACLSYDAQDNPSWSASYADLDRKPINVRYFSRFNFPQYQGEHPPFRSRTKSGNYNSLLDFVLNTLGRRYDILCQLDTDHAPAPDYLDKILAPFASDDVAYVAAPSINRRNDMDNWASVARWHMEAPFHGMMQMGLAADGNPLIMGSHVAYDLPKLLEKNGFDESRAEDLLHTLNFAVMDSRKGGGYKGAFAENAHAVGYGPSSFADSIKQETRWAQSVAEIFFSRFIGRATRHLSWAETLSFSGHQLYYLNTALPYFVLSMLPAVALALDLPGPSFDIVDFAWRYGFVLLGILPFWAFGKAYGLLRPRDAQPMLAHYALLEVTRWPWYLIGFVRGTIQAFTGKTIEFGNTRKGVRDAHGEALPLSLFVPHLAIMVLNGAGIAIYTLTHAPGAPLPTMGVWALGVNAIYGAALLFVAINNALRMRRQGIPGLDVLRRRWANGAAVLVANGLNACAFAWLAG